MEEPIYITGSGIISAIGNNKEEVLQSLLQEKSGVAEMRYLQSEHTELPVGEVKYSDQEMRDLLNLPADKPANRTSLMGTLALKETIAEAGLTEEELKSLTFISGTTVGGMDYTERCFLQMPEDDEALKVLATHDCGSTSLLQAEYFGMDTSKVMTTSTACSSAANAMIVGSNLIKTGQADIVIAGGSEAITKFHLNGFNTLMILDHEQCRPFDETRKGLNLGEGAAYVVLESAASVRRRGVKPLAVLLGYGNACDAFHQTASSPDGEGAYLAMEDALKMSGVSADSIQYVNAHGTGTPNNDSSESAALRRVFGDAMPLVSSTKSYTGHTTSASGTVEAVICMLALQHQFAPANLGWKNQMSDGITPTVGNPSCQLDYIMCNSFGFGGNDSSLILGKYDESQLQLSDEMMQNRQLRKVYVRAISKHEPGTPITNLSDFIKPMEARRMCALLKSALVSSMTALREAGIECPDGIFVGTKFGMLSNSEKFLVQMCGEGEHTLSPTFFMQSTHNTIAGMLALRTKCHGYNITFTQGKKSLDCVLKDAAMQIALGKLDNALVGSHDESTQMFHDLLLKLTGEEAPVGESSVAMVLTADPTDALYEYELGK